MSARVIVHLQEFPGVGTIFSLEGPKGYPLSNTVVQLPSLPTQTPFQDMHSGDGSPNRVLEAGKKLLDDLSLHSAVKDAISDALREKMGGCSPIYLRMDDVTMAEDLPWEAIYSDSQKGFLALDDRWPIVRIREAKEADPRLVYDFEPPLRITAILSAAGSDARTRAPAAPQWRVIYQAIQKRLAVAGAMPVALTVLVGEAELRDQIDGLHEPWIQCALITDREGLLDKIKESRPQLLHFFCHGTSDEMPHLKIGSYADWEAGLDGKIAITADELRQLADPQQDIWLVTLNCCESATRARDARSIASSLVAAGFPAALGMREMIDVQYAHKLCETFYPALLDLIGKAVVGGEARDIEWAQALSSVRAGLAVACVGGTPAQQAAKSTKTWTIPALYMRREAFLMRRIAAAAAPPPVLSEAKKKKMDYLLELQRRRSKAAEDYKDLPAETLKDLLGDFDSEIAKVMQELRKAV